MASILITGGAGFIGSHTGDALLARGHRVRVLDNLEPQVHSGSDAFPEYLHPDIERVRGDVRDPIAVREALDGIDAVFHFAALTGVGQSMYERERYEAVNGYGTLNLLDEMAKMRPRPIRLVLASSRAVYGEGSHRCPNCGIVHPSVRSREAMERGEFGVSCPLCGRPAIPAPTPERRPLKPISVYGQTKAWQEILCRSFARDTGVSTVILRYFNVYGSRQSLQNPYTGIMSIFYSRIRDGQPVEIYEAGTPTRDFVHVSDAVQANVLALGADVPPGMAINVGTGVETSLRSVAESLPAAMGAPKTPIIDVDTFRLGDLHACHANLGRARRLLGYVPRTSLDEGIREFVAWADAEASVDLSQRAATELAEHGALVQAGRPKSARAAGPAAGT